MISFCFIVMIRWKIISSYVIVQILLISTFFIKSETDNPNAFAYSVMALRSPSDTRVDNVGIYVCLQLFTHKVW